MKMFAKGTASLLILLKTLPFIVLVCAETKQN
jgi:hypothetical protein